MKDRKYYLDNIRWMTVVLVIIYHIIYLFNCSGAISNIQVKGIPVMDGFLIFVYPWFMCLLFVISGMSTKYSLEKRTNKEFINDRKKRILIPSIAGIFIYGWVSGLITSKYTDMFMGNGDKIPGLIKYLIYCLMGVGPLWYAHVLFIASILIIVMKKIDKQNKISEICCKIKLWMLIPLYFIVWGSSCVLNTPMITVYRFGIYLFMFLLGYYVFADEKLQKYGISLMIVTLIIGIIYVITFYGQNYTEDSILQNWFTNLYLCIAIISILSFGMKYLNFNNKFTEYMTKNNFNFYVLHYIIVLLLGYLVVTYLKFPFILNYIIILFGTIIILPIFTEFVKIIPVINRLVLGKINKRNEK